MPGQARKSAAVPFINQKGERSMKRVKVERYVAGKLPSYAKKEEDDDDDDEYYTTDDSEYSSEQEEETQKETRQSHDSSDDRLAIGADDVPMPDVKHNHHETYEQSRFHLQYDPDEDDNPLIRALRRNALTRIRNALDLQLLARSAIKSNQNVILEDEEEDIRERHRMVRDIVVKETLSIESVLGDDDFSDLSRLGAWQQPGGSTRSQREETEDILDGLMVQAFKHSHHEKEEKSQMESSIKDMIEQAKEEAVFKSQLDKKIEEDKKMEKAIEALKKDELGTYEMESVKTDDEDEDIAYEEWKLREIKRILRDRTSRLIESKNKSIAIR